MDSREIISASARYIEENLCQPLSLEQLAAMAGFSQYHYSRLFSLYMNMPVMEYVRRRRLAHAAFDICEGKRILDIAMDYGFESHSGFAKAFRKVYGFSPEDYRRRAGSHRALAINPLLGSPPAKVFVPNVRVEHREGFYIAGRVIRTGSDISSIARSPALWNQVWLLEEENKIYAMAHPSQHGEYYISFPMETGMYRLVTCVRIDDPEDVDDGLYIDWVPPGLYGVFSPPLTDGNLAQAVTDTWKYAFDRWFPNSNYEPDPKGLDYEFYDERCHGAPYTMDICIPLIPKGE